MRNDNWIETDQMLGKQSAFKDIVLKAGNSLLVGYWNGSTASDLSATLFPAWYFELQKQ